jgi:hypothetical protein
MIAGAVVFQKEADISPGVHTPKDIREESGTIREGKVKIAKRD